MTNEPLVFRLNELNEQIVRLYLERPTVVGAYYKARFQEIAQGMQSGLSATSARDYADGNTFMLKDAMDSLDAELAAALQEQSHLRFIAEHLT